MQRETENAQFLLDPLLDGISEPRYFQFFLQNFETNSEHFSGKISLEINWLKPVATIPKTQTPLLTINLPHTTYFCPEKDKRSSAKTFQTPQSTLQR